MANPSRPPKYVLATVAAATQAEYIADLVAATMAALEENLTGSRWADREHCYRQIVTAVYDWHQALWMGDGGKFEQRVRELSGLE